MSEKEKVLSDAKERMQKSLHSLTEDLGTIRAGKANPAVLSKIQVESYGGHVHLNQVANIFVQDAKTLIIEPWDKSTLKEIEKSIQKSSIGIMPINDGRMIRIVFPPLTEERRNDLAKVLHKMGEETKVAIRNIRRDINDHVKKMEKDKIFTEDDKKRLEEEIQKITDQNIVKIDDEIKHKEKEIHEI